MDIKIKARFSQSEIDKINSIFLEYPDKVANISRYIFDCVPYEDAVYATYSDGIQPYGLKVDIIDMYDKEVAKVKNLRSLPWVLLSSEEDIRNVCNFVQKHIDDGTFELHEKLVPTGWKSLIDGKIHKATPWTDTHFKPYTVKEADKYPWFPEFMDD